MDYRLRLHDQVRAWLTGLQDAEPVLARQVGEALLALLEAGQSLGPPLVVPLESALGAPADPREALDFSYQRQLEMLTRVRRGVADVATSRKRVELQVAQLEESTGDVSGQLRDLRQQLSALRAEEDKLTQASQRLQARVDAFRNRKESAKAAYTADEALRRVREDFAELGELVSDPEITQAPDDIASAETAASEIMAEADELTPAPAGPSGFADRGAPVPPPGLFELRPGAPGMRVGLLVVARPPDLTVLVAWEKHPGRPVEEYQEVTRLAVARRADPAVSYDAESFLDEFFPGAAAEVEIGAAALTARHRARTLAQARERMRLTQAQVAARMNVHPERVAAIEAAEPGATEIRTLAAYVRALGGRLEIVADIAGDRIPLR